MSASVQPSSAAPLRVPVLDVLRALAVLAVFAQHVGDRFRPFVFERASVHLPTWATLWLKTLIERGHWGVDLFFVLSGFTLGMGFVRDHQRGSHRPASEFFARRAARILPAFFVAIGLHLIARPDVWHSPRLAESLAIHALLLQGYLSPGGIVLIGASWSLTTESHFYAAAPWLARWLLGLEGSRLPAGQGSGSLSRGRGRGWGEGHRNLVILAAATLAICIPVWILRGALHDFALTAQAPAGLLELSQRRWVVSRIDQFALGLAASIAHAWIMRSGWKSRTLSWALVVGGVAGLMAAAPLDHFTWPQSGGAPAYAIVSVAMTALVIGAALIPYPRRALALEPLRFLGVVSYGFFLYHQLAIDLVSKWIAPAAAACSWRSLAWTSIPALSLALLVGWLSWILIEAPALAWASRKRKVTAAQDASA